MATHGRSFVPTYKWPISLIMPRDLCRPVALIHSMEIYRWCALRLESSHCSFWWVGWKRGRWWLSRVCWTTSSVYRVSFQRTPVLSREPKTLWPCWGRRCIFSHQVWTPWPELDLQWHTLDWRGYWRHLHKNCSPRCIHNCICHLISLPCTSLWPLKLWYGKLHACGVIIQEKMKANDFISVNNIQYIQHWDLMYWRSRHWHESVVINAGQMKLGFSTIAHNICIFGSWDSAPIHACVYYISVF